MKAWHSVKWQKYKSLARIPDNVTNFLSNSAHGSILQSPKWYLRIANNPSRYMVVAALEGDHPVFAALVRKSHIPATTYYMGSIERGPVFKEVDQAISLWEEFESLLHGDGLRALKIHPFWEREKASRLNAYLLQRGYGRAFEMRSHTETVTIDLNPSEEAIFNTLKGSRRNLIRKAVKLGIRVDMVKTKEEMERFWRMYRDMSLSKGLSYWPLAKFERIRRFGIEHPRDCVCLIGSLEGEIIGGHIALRHADVVEVTRGGASIRLNNGVPKTDLILWESILWAKRQGARVYDFGGIAPNAEKGSPEWGVNRFKFDFSARRILLFEPMEKIFNAKIYNMHASMKKVKKVVKQLLPKSA
jgi:lipid II:glycine glycyltransferase (peptidoglycan interpeptide bridge formation enzyme)